MPNAQLQNIQHLREYVTAGHAVFTIRVKDPSSYFTLQVRKSDKQTLWFVDGLVGPDNTHDYVYLGALIRDDQDVFRLKKFKRDYGTTSKVAVWLATQLNQDHIHPNIEFWHSGTCSKCGRRLTTPESIERGIGPTCVKRL